MPTFPFILGTLSHYFLRLACSDVRIEGLENLTEAIQSDRPVLTFSNHISVLDDPLMWGVLPPSMWLQAKTTRWVMGARDLMFRGTLDSWFFSRGHVISTDRGGGIYQEALDVTVAKLRSGNFVHVFPEAKIKQDGLYNPRRFKWGIGRLLLNCPEPPIIIPIFIKGFEQVMSEERGFPRFLPRPRKIVTITIGKPINNVIEPMLDEMRERLGARIWNWRPSFYSENKELDYSLEPKALTKARICIVNQLTACLNALDTPENTKFVSGSL